MEEEFLANGVPHIRENLLSVLYKDKILRSKFKTDFTIYGKIVVEVKSSDEGIAQKTTSQILNYLKASGYRLGLIINFSRNRLEYKRLIV
jgi:GxxExxY protein